MAALVAFIKAATTPTGARDSGNLKPGAKDLKDFDHVPLHLPEEVHAATTPLASLWALLEAYFVNHGFKDVAALASFLSVHFRTGENNDQKAFTRGPAQSGTYHLFARKLPGPNLPTTPLPPQERTSFGLLRGVPPHISAPLLGLNFRDGADTREGNKMTPLFNKIPQPLLKSGETAATFLADMAVVRAAYQSAPPPEKESKKRTAGSSSSLSGSSSSSSSSSSSGNGGSKKQKLNPSVLAVRKLANSDVEAIVAKTTVRHMRNAEEYVKSQPEFVMQTINMANFTLQNSPRSALMETNKESSAALGNVVTAALFVGEIDKLDANSKEVEALRAAGNTNSPIRLKFQTPATKTTAAASPTTAVDTTENENKAPGAAQ